MRKILAQIVHGKSTYTIIRDTDRMQEYAVFRFDRIMKKFDKYEDALEFVAYIVRITNECRR